MNDETKSDQKLSIVDTTGQQLSRQGPKPLKPVAMETPIDTLIAAAVNQDLDIAKLERLIELRDKEEAKTAFAQYVVAISNFQAQCPNIPKTGQVKDKHGNYLYNYPKMDKIMEIAKPHLEANGLCVRTDTEFIDKTVRATVKVSHIGGHTDETTFVVPIEANMAGGANAAQRTASANSFAKRYGVMNALNLVGSDDDDDGAGTGAEVEYISEATAAGLRDEIEMLGGDEQFFCTWLGIDSLEQMPVKLHPKARKEIDDQTKTIQEGGS